MAPYSPTPKAISPVVALTMTWRSVEVEAVNVSTTVHSSRAGVGGQHADRRFVPETG